MKMAEGLLSGILGDEDALKYAPSWKQLKDARDVLKIRLGRAAAPV
jgi:hypothetical protein